MQHKSKMMKAFKPYFIEAIFTVVLYLISLISYIVSIILLVDHTEDLNICDFLKALAPVNLVFLCILVFEYVITLHRALLALLDYCFHCYTCAEVILADSGHQFSISAKQFTTMLKYLNIGKLYVYARAKDGKLRKLYMTTTIAVDFDMFVYQHNHEKVKVIYGRFSKIIFEVDG